MMTCSPSFLRSVDIETLRDILDTNYTTRFGSMFSWAMSPQGHRYWSDLRNRSEIIPDEARGYLEDILHAVDPSYIPSLKAIPYDPNQIGDTEDDL